MSRMPNPLGWLFEEHISAQNVLPVFKLGSMLKVQSCMSQLNK